LFSLCSCICCPSFFSDSLDRTRLFRGQPVFTRAKLRRFYQPCWFKNTDRLGSAIYVRSGPYTLPRTPCKGQLECQKHKVLSTFDPRGGGPTLKSSACLNTGFVRMWAPHSGLLSTNLGTAILTPKRFKSIGVQ